MSYQWKISNETGDGHLFYDNDLKKIKVSHPNPITAEQITNYLAQERDFFDVALDHPAGGFWERGVATDHVSFLEQALSEMQQKIGVSVEEEYDEDCYYEDECSELQVEPQQERACNYSKVVDFAGVSSKKHIKILIALREYEDRYEYQIVEQYEDKFQRFQAHSIQLADAIFPQLFDFGDRSILVSVDFFKDKFRLPNVVKWLEKNNVILGAKDSSEVIIKDANKIIAGLQFKGYPIVAYSRGSKSIKVDTKTFIEVSNKFVSTSVKIDTGESKDVLGGLAIIYNGQMMDGGIPSIEVDVTRDIIICNGTVIVADYIGEYHGCLAFFRDDEKIPVSFVVDTNTAIYIDSYDRDDTGAKIYVIKFKYLINLEEL